MTDDLNAGNLPGLLTAWAEAERKRLFQRLRAKEVEEGIQPGRLHPETMPIYRNILALEFSFDPKRKHSTGRVRALFVLFDHGRRTGKAWISIATLMEEAGFSERNNARKAVEDLHVANIVPKTQRPPTEESPRYGTNVYTIPDEADLLDLVFAAATGITALYTFVLRKIWVDEDGVGSAYVSRKGVRDALAEGVLDENRQPVLDRTLSDTKIVEHFRTLLSDKLVLKVDNGRVTIPAARGHQAIKEGATRVWDREDRGTKKPRRSKSIVSLPNFPPPSHVDAVSPPPPRVSANLSPPPNGAYPNLSPPKPPQTPLNIKGTEWFKAQQMSNHLSPQIRSGEPSLPADPEGAFVAVVSTSAMASSREVESWRQEVRAAGTDHDEGCRRLAEVVPLDDLTDRIGAAIGPAMPDSKRWHRQAVRSWGLHKLRKALLRGADDEWLVETVQQIGEVALKAGEPLQSWTAVSLRIDPLLAQIGAVQ